MAFTRVEFTVNGRITGFGSHTLVLTQPPFKYTFSEDGAERIEVDTAKM